MRVLGSVSWERFMLALSFLVTLYQIAFLIVDQTWENAFFVLLWAMVFTTTLRDRDERRREAKLKAKIADHHALGVFNDVFIGDRCPICKDDEE